METLGDSPLRVGGQQDHTRAAADQHAQVFPIRCV